jgi:hypothetical protein
MQLTTQEKIERLYMAIALIQDADAGIQTALGDTEECYSLHCGCEALIDDVRDTIDAMEADTVA